MFDDEWLGKEGNAALLDFLVRHCWVHSLGFAALPLATVGSLRGSLVSPPPPTLQLGWMLRDPACSLSARNLAEPEIVDPRPVTHVAELAARPRMCLQAREAGGRAVHACMLVANAAAP